MSSQWTWTDAPARQRRFIEQTRADAAQARCSFVESQRRRGVEALTNAAPGEARHDAVPASVWRTDGRADSAGARQRMVAENQRRGQAPLPYGE